MFYIDAMGHFTSRICSILMQWVILLLEYVLYCQNKTFPDEFSLVQMAESVEEPKKAVKMMTWTPPMSACLLRCLAHIAAKGVKTDKGFKEVHITKSAKDVTQLVGYEVTTTQVTNHLRKWKTKWQKIDKFRT
jgi:hypothetical protein